MLTDSHVHTKHFSGDAKMTIDEVFAAAVERGLDSIVITEHYDDDFPHDMEGPMTFDPNDYYAAFQNWQERLPEGLDLRLGIELGYQPQLVERYTKLSKELPFDSIILSNHLFGGKDPFFFRECYEKDKKVLHEEYIATLAEMAEQCNCFDILGHFDYIVRYSEKPDSFMRYRDCPHTFDRLFNALVQNGKSLEVNTRTIQKLRRAGVSDEDSFPDAEALLRYRRLGGERITLGSDAHEPSSLASLFDETARYLIGLGFEYNTTYVHRSEMRTTLIDYTSDHEKK
ncbi:MAG: histidinol-phosphatase HisJ family protein [Clostridiales bacterium]|nr:histidinol-phosphatase HisJ family protein [Clostridiales bacterium]